MFSLRPVLIAVHEIEVFHMLFGSRELASTLRREFRLARPTRSVIVRCRIWFYVGLRRRLVLAGESSSVAERTVKYNLSSLSFVGNRVLRLLRILSSLESTLRRSLLIIGCRNEDDLFVADSLGFLKVVGLDLISYSDRVVVGDMHKLPFPDGSFDCVLIPYTLSYSNDVRSSLAEITRVTRRGGTVALAVEFLSEKGVNDVMGCNDPGFILPGDGYPLRDTDSFISLFPAGSFRVIYDNSPKYDYTCSLEAGDADGRPVELILRIL